MLKIKSFLKERFFRKELPWAELFKLFKGVIDSNNKALDVITDMGEKLGGDYLFDVNYINTAYPELSGAVDNSIKLFTALTQDRYRNIRGIFDRIDDRIQRAINDASARSGRAVLPYEEISFDLSREVGGKNANLADIKNQLKLKVPAAFAITTHAFDMFIRHNRLDSKIQGITGSAEVSEEALHELRGFVISAEMPPEVSTDIKNALEILKAGSGGPCFVAVRSSAEEEDGDFSFAGQFKTVLNVPAELRAVESAYKEVIASLFSPEAAAYIRSLGCDIWSVKMAVGVVAQVDAASSGVIFSSSPAGDTADIWINAAWGLGVSVVDGKVDSDLYIVKKPAVGAGFELVSKRYGRKSSMTVATGEGGTSVNITPDTKINAPCLTDEQVYDLASKAVLIEKHFRKPQDIEWAVDKSGAVYILQARPLKVQEAHIGVAQSAPIPMDARVVMEGKGIAVYRGAGAGSVFILNREDELAGVPKGAVLVSKTDSAKFVRIMPQLSAIITDTGAPTSHMASICREFKVPTLVNTGDATVILKHGQAVTLNIDEDGNATVYDGLLRELVKSAEARVFGMEGISEYRRKRYILRYISPLNLIDPLMDNFTPEGCKTVHDVLRFIHEKSVAELVDDARQRSIKSNDKTAVRLELPIPAALMVVDLGGGLDIAAGQEKAGLEQVSSLPLASILKGMTYPGVWHSETVSLNARDFFTSMARMTDIRNDAESFIGNNLAVASREYVNLNLRFGYHFNMIDAYCSGNARNNHVYFRFVGGATDIVKRSRRVSFIETVLKEYGFGINIKGDLIIARLSNIREDRMQEILNQLGRLISYTRQMDAMLHSDELVARYAANFLEGNYNF